MATPLNRLVAVCGYYGTLDDVKEYAAECLEKGVDISSADNKWEVTPLMAACRSVNHKELEIVAHLLQCGADVRTHAPDRSNLTALHFAILDRDTVNLAVVKLLLAHGADVTATGNGGAQALHVAMQKPFNRELVEMLIDAGADINTATTSGVQVGFTPLHFACFRSDLDAAEFLLSRGVDVDARNANGLTPLGVAISWQKNVNLPLMELLLQHGAQVNVVDNDGNSLAWSHVKDGAANAEVLKLLINNGVDILTTENEQEGQSLLHLMVNNREARPDAMDMVLERGVPINGLNKEGETPLHFVCSRPWCLFAHHVEYLLSRGAQASLVVENAYGDLPFHSATRHIPTNVPSNDSSCS